MFNTGLKRPMVRRPQDPHYGHDLSDQNYQREPERTMQL